MVMTSNSELVQALLNDNDKLVQTYSAEDLKLVCEQGESALHIAARNGSAKCISFILSLPDTGVNVANRAGRTPLHIAAASDNSASRSQILRSLVSAGANPAVCDGKGESPMHILLNHGDHILDDMKILVDAVTRGKAVALQRPLTAPPASFSPVSDAVDAIRRGEMVVVLDNEDRENEGDLIMAAEKATPDMIAFMVRYATGVICCAIPGETCDRLELPAMVVDNTEKHQTAFTHSVDYKHDTTTGISSADRALTLTSLVDPSSKPDDFNRPGHIFPLRAREGGVLERDGHTEASVDLSRLAGLTPGGVICEICNDDGTMSRLPELQIFAGQHNLLLTTITAMQEYIRGMKQ